MNISQVCFPLEIPQRATFSETIQVQYLDGTPVNLTNWTAKMQIRQTHADTDVIATLSTSDGTIIITGSTGTVQLLLPASITKILPAPFDGVYDLLLIAPTGDPTVNRLLNGKISISPGVTVLP